MPLDPQLRKQLGETIYVAVAQGEDEYGNPAYGAPTAYPARIRHLVRRDRSSITAEAGSESHAKAQVVTEVAIGPRDRIWLPGGNPNDPSQSQVPLRVAAVIDERGNRIATEVWF